MTYRIVDVPDDEQHPYALLDEDGTVLRVASNPRILSAWALEQGADCRHDEDLILAEERTWKS